MAKKVNRSGESVQVYLSPEVKAALVELAARNGRTLTDELAAAARRHLAAPPVVRVEEPPLPAEVVVKGKPRKGRPPKKQPTDVVAD